jgi:hypothetical protein
MVSLNLPMVSLNLWLGTNSTPDLSKSKTCALKYHIHTDHLVLGEMEAIRCATAQPY